MKPRSARWNSEKIFKARGSVQVDILRFTMPSPARAMLRAGRLFATGAFLKNLACRRGKGCFSALRPVMLNGQDNKVLPCKVNCPVILDGKAMPIWRSCPDSSIVLNPSVREL